MAIFMGFQFYGIAHIIYIMLLDVVFVVLVIGLLVAIYKLKFKAGGNAQATIQQRQPLFQQLREENKPAERGPIWAPIPDEEPLSSEQEDASSTNQVVDRRKQLRKQEKAREKQRRKQALDQFLENERQKKQKEEQEQEEQQKIEQQKKRKEEEFYQKLVQEEEKKKKEEYDKWKGMFTVETEGKAKQSEQEEARKKEELLMKMLKVLKKRKLSLLEDLAHQFTLTTKEVIEKIKELQGRGEVTGIFDERGKYMVIEENEWKAIRNYIQARGRIRKTDIMQECARIIKIPDLDEVDENILSLVDQDKQINS